MTVGFQGTANFAVLSDEKFEHYAVGCYDNPQCTGAAEFKTDLRRFAYLNRLFTAYQETGEMRCNLALNHLVVLYNVFNDSATAMLFHRIDRIHWKVLIPFLLFINRMPEVVLLEDTPLLYLKDHTHVDHNVIEELRKL